MLSCTSGIVVLSYLSLLSTTAAGSASDPLSERDTSFTLDEPLLAVQIGGIIAAYLFSVIFLLSLLLVVGRRLRRAVLSSNYSLQVQMLQPMKPPPSMDPSPITPISVHLPSPGGIGPGTIPAIPEYHTGSTATTRANRSWSTFSKHSGSHKKSQSQLSNPSSSISLATFDEGVVTSDRRKAQADLEMLYAAVMEHDEQKKVAGAHDVSPTAVSVASNPFTDPPAALPAHAVPTSPRTPSRLSRISSSLSLFSSRDQSSTSLSHVAAGPPSKGGSSNGASGGRLRSPRLALPLRKMSISSPITSPGYATASDPHKNEEDDPYAHSPLTPRIYNPPPPPVPPLPAQVQSRNTTNNTTGGGGAQRPGPHRELTHPAPQQHYPPHYHQPYQQQQQQQQQYSQDDTIPDHQPSLPLPLPRGIPTHNFDPATTTQSRKSTRILPPPLTLINPGTPPAGGPGGQRSLPLRDAYPLQSAPATKLTVLERPVRPLGAPRTGVPTPYSPYMPFTPVTPLTPSRMVTKRQRRKQGRETGLHVLNEDDLVKGGGDMWGY